MQRPWGECGCSRVKGAGRGVTRTDHAGPCRDRGPCKGHGKNTGDYCETELQDSTGHKRNVT